MLGFLKKFLSYLIPDEESNISFLNWLFRLVLVLSICLGFILVITNSLRDTEVGKNYGLISVQNSNKKITVNSTTYARLFKDTWSRLQTLKYSFPNSFYFAYIAQFYNVYADDFVTGLKNEQSLVSFWVEPQGGTILNFNGLEEILNRRANELKQKRINSNNKDCEYFPISEQFYPFLRQTFTNFKENEQLIDVMVCPIYKLRSQEIFALNVMYYKKLGEYKSLELAFKSLTNKIATDFQVLIQ